MCQYVGQKGGNGAQSDTIHGPRFPTTEESMQQHSRIGPGNWLHSFGNRMYCANPRGPQFAGVMSEGQSMAESSSASAKSLQRTNPDRPYRAPYQPLPGTLSLPQSYAGIQAGPKTPSLPQSYAGVQPLPGTPRLPQSYAGVQHLQGTPSLPQPYSGVGVQPLPGTPSLLQPYAGVQPLTGTPSLPQQHVGGQPLPGTPCLPQLYAGLQPLTRTPSLPQQHTGVQPLTRTPSIPQPYVGVQPGPATPCPLQRIPTPRQLQADADIQMDASSQQVSHNLGLDCCHFG